MDDDLDQLLSRLKLSRIQEIIGERLDTATKSGPSYSDFLRQLLREEPCLIPLAICLA